MNYARRLLAMSTRAAAPSRPVALPIEEQVVDEAPVPTTAAPALRTEPVAPAEVGQALVPSAPPPMQPRVMPEVPAREARVVAPPLAREVARVEQPAPPRAPEPLPVPPDPAPAPIAAREPIAPLPSPVSAAPALPAWLTDEPDAPDPLDALAQSDEARDLMRAIRRWTSAPVPAAIASPPLPVEAPPVPEAPATDPVQLSIGNVVITVEDTPAAPRRAAATPSVAHTGGSRLARHYFRGR